MDTVKWIKPSFEDEQIVKAMALELDIPVFTSCIY